MSDERRDPTPAEIDKWTAEAEKARAERDQANAEARRVIAHAERAEVDARKALREEQDELAKNPHHKVYVFDDAVSDSSVKACIRQLSTWARQSPGCPIEIQINSPGGSIFEGFVLIDFLRDLREKGHHITIIAYGMAASMAGVILQAADVRVMGRHAFLLIHEGSLGASGDWAQVQDRVELMKLFHTKILDLFAQRSKVKASWIKTRWARKDWWLTSEECLKHGFVDEVR